MTARHLMTPRVGVLLLSLVLFAAPALADPPSPRAPGTVADAFDAPPVHQWRVRLPGQRLPALRHIERTRPVIVDDSIFVGAAGGNALYELSRRNGRLVRTYPAAASVESAATVHDDRIWFADTAGHTWCYSRDGDLLWRHSAAAPILVQPTVHDDHVYVVTVDDVAFALHAETGELEWQYRQPPPAFRPVELALYASPDPLIVDDQVVFGFSEGAVVAVDQQRGESVYDRLIAEGRYPDLVATPTWLEGRLLVSGFDLPFVSLDMRGDAVSWRAEVGAAAPVALDTSQDPSVIYHPGADGRLRALQADSGATLWTWDSQTESALTQPQRTAAGLLVGAAAGSVYLVDPDDGSELWQYPGPQLLEGVASAPYVEGRQVVFVTNAGWLVSMQAPRPSAERWRRAVDWRRRGPADGI